MSVSRVMVPFEKAAPAGSAPFASLASAALAGVAFAVAAVRTAQARRQSERRGRRIAAERHALVQMARAHADTQPSFAADLYSAATRHGSD